MKENEGILIADEDNSIRQKMAEFFVAQGYQVETTDSAAQVLCNILEKKAPVLVLGSDFDKKVAPDNLVHLLKKCNRNLAILFVSDVQAAPHDLSAEEPCFAPAAKPKVTHEIEEIQHAIEGALNAFKKLLRSQSQQPTYPHS
ncbi:MAG: hypothetical protein P8X63_00485 [Desulfuromonadaceae bacterium]